MKKTFSAFTICTTLLLTACASSKNDTFIDQMTQPPSFTLLTSSHWLVVAGHHFDAHSVKHKLKKNAMVCTSFLTHIELNAVQRQDI